MRRLIIHRKGSFLGCRSIVNFYILDEKNGNTMISNLKCRKIGELKNKEEKAFEIPNEQQKFLLYMIS